MLVIELPSTAQADIPKPFKGVVPIKLHFPVFFVIVQEPIPWFQRPKSLPGPGGAVESFNKGIQKPSIDSEVRDLYSKLHSLGDSISDIQGCPGAFSIENKLFPLEGCFSIFR